MGASSASLNTAANAVFLLAEAEKIARALREAAAPALFVKGIALLETAYSDLAARPLSDVDIVVPPRDLPRVAAVLRRLGYAQTEALDFIKRGRIPSRVDLHLGLWFFSGKKLWKSAVSKKIGGETVLVPGPEYLMLHAMLHSLLQDGEISATAREDVRRLAAQPRWEWKKFWQLAREEGWSRAARAFLDGKTVPGKTAYGRMWRSQEHPLKKVRLLLRVLFPPAAFLKLRYPRCPAWLLPFARPAILLFNLCYIEFGGKNAEQTEQAH